MGWDRWLRCMGWLTVMLTKSVPTTSNALSTYVEQQTQFTKRIKIKIKKQTATTKATKN